MEKVKPAVLHVFERQPMAVAIDTKEAAMLRLYRSLSAQDQATLRMMAEDLRQVSGPMR